MEPVGSGSNTMLAGVVDAVVVRHAHTMPRRRQKGTTFSTRQPCEMSRRRPFDLVVLSAGGRSIGAGGWARSCAFGITWSKTSCARVVSREDRADSLPWRDREHARAEETQRCKDSSQR